MLKKKKKKIITQIIIPTVSISTPAISDEVVGAPHEGKPEHVIFVNKLIEVLIKKENSWSH